VCTVVACTNRQEQIVTDEHKKMDTRKNDEVIEAYVVFALDYADDICVGIRISDKRLIDDLILSPINNSKTDPEPAKYIILGCISLRHQDGSETSYTLYYPWGHFSRDQKYYIADLNKLRDAVKKALDAKNMWFISE
jgi:hypothetical protein